MIRLFAVAAAILLGATGWIAAADSDDPFAVHRDDQTGSVTITIAARDGIVHENDIRRGLAEACRLDPDALASESTDHVLDLNNRSTRWRIAALSAAVPDVKLRVARPADSASWTLVIRLESGEADQKVRLAKQLLREQFAGDLSGYGLKLDEHEPEASRARPLAVLVHGYSSHPKSLESLRQSLSDRGICCALFAYPNDAPIQEAGTLLAGDLRKLARQDRARRVDIVAHSMGGLVARLAIEDPGLDPGNVRRLIMVGTPNHGTQWAEFPGGLDGCEHLVWDPQTTLREIVQSSFADGLNEARSDLKPDSAFLKRLNSRERNPRVRYSLILGTGAQFDAVQFAEFQKHVRQAVASHRLLKVLEPRISSIVDDFEEVQAGKGDGVVAVDRGRLAGVQDVVLLPMAHSALTSQSGVPAELLEAIVTRLAGAN
jgi:pimeloyl-ACP methyl ester carboxylesterase